MKINSQAAVTSLLVAALAIPGTLAAKESDDGGFKLFIRDAQGVVGGGTEIFGRITSGSVSVGDTVCVPLNSGETEARKVEDIVEFSKKLETAEKGKSVHIVVSDVSPDDVRNDHYLDTACQSESD